MTTVTKTEAMSLCLSMILEECGTDSDCLHAVLQTMIKIMRNIQQNPMDDKYRTIRKQNKTFYNRVWKWESAQQFLYAVGWIDVDESIALTEIGNVSPALSLLEQALSEHSPNASATRQPSSDNENSEKDKKMNEARKRLLERLEKEKVERQKIKDQIKADRRDVNTRETKASKARNLNRDSAIKKFQDIGVDLNRGGG